MVLYHKAGFAIHKPNGPRVSIGICVGKLRLFATNERFSGYPRNGKIKPKIDKGMKKQAFFIKRYVLPKITRPSADYFGRFWSLLELGQQLNAVPQTIRVDRVSFLGSSWQGQTAHRTALFRYVRPCGSKLRVLRCDAIDHRFRRIDRACVAIQCGGRRAG